MSKLQIKALNVVKEEMKEIDFDLHLIYRAVSNSLEEQLRLHFEDHAETRKDIQKTIMTACQDAMITTNGHIKIAKDWLDVVIEELELESKNG